MAKHIVKQGDCLSSIGKQYGFFPDTLWNLPENVELKQKRKKPTVLFPGDQLFIPDKREKQESGATEKRHRFRLKGTPAHLHLRLIDLNDEPRQNVDYIIDIDGELRSGTTDDDGCIDEPIPPDARQAILTLLTAERTQSGQQDDQVYNGPEEQEYDEEEHENEEYEILLGHTDPITEVRGLQERLINLGYDLDSVTGQYDERTRKAVKAFQAKQNIEQTGEFDEATRRELEDLHGS